MLVYETNLPSKSVNELRKYKQHSLDKPVNVTVLKINSSKL
jgi:hypothetical protein